MTWPPQIYHFVVFCRVGGVHSVIVTHDCFSSCSRTDAWTFSFRSLWKRADFIVHQIAGPEPSKLEVQPFLTVAAMFSLQWVSSFNSPMDTIFNLIILLSTLTSWLSSWHTFGIIGFEQPVLRRFSTVPCFLNLKIMALTEIRLSPNILKLQCNPF